MNLRRTASGNVEVSEDVLTFKATREVKGLGIGVTPRPCTHAKPPPPRAFHRTPRVSAFSSLPSGGPPIAAEGPKFAVGPQRAGLRGQYPPPRGHGLSPEAHPGLRIPLSAFRWASRTRHVHNGRRIQGRRPPKSNPRAAAVSIWVRDQVVTPSLPASLQDDRDPHGGFRGQPRPAPPK